MKMPRITNTIDEITKDYNYAKEKPDVFYAQSFLNRNGGLLDNDNNKVTISNQIATWMFDSNPLYQVKRIRSNMPYWIDRNGMPTTKTQNSNREEELVAMALFRKKDYTGSDIDRFVNYQVPIYRGHEYKDEHIGKIDLVAISHKDKRILLMELKKYSSDETLLRCVCESYTYYKQICSCKLRKEISGQQGYESVENYQVLPAVLVFKDRRQHAQYESELFDKVKELMKSLGVSMYVIDSSVQFDSKQYDAYIDQCTITEVK